MVLKNDKSPALPRPDFAQNHTVEYSMWGWDYTRYNTLMKFIDDSFIFVFGQKNYHEIRSLIIGVRIFNLELLSLISTKNEKYNKQRDQNDEKLKHLESVSLRDISESEALPMYNTLIEIYSNLLITKTEIGLSSRNVNQTVANDRQTIVKTIVARVCS